MIVQTVSEFNNGPEFDAAYANQPIVQIALPRMFSTMPLNGTGDYYAFATIPTWEAFRQRRASPTAVEAMQIQAAWGQIHRERERLAAAQNAMIAQSQRIYTAGHLSGGGGYGGSGGLYNPSQGDYEMAMAASQAQNIRFNTAGVVQPISTPAPAKSVDLATVEELTDEMVDHYGVDAMVRSSRLSDKLLAMSGGTHDDEFANKLSELTALAKGLDPKEAAKGRGWWWKVLNMVGLAKEKVAAQFKMLDAQIGTLANELNVHSSRQRQRGAELESLFKENSDSYTEIEKLVKAGREYLAKPRPALAEVSSPMEAQNLSDRRSREARLDKRLADLDVAMTLMVQTAPEIRIMQANGRALADKFTTLINLTIPSWKKQFALHVMQLEQKRSASVANAIDDATNEAFKKNADVLRENTVTIASSGQRQIMDMETVEHVQRELIATVADVQEVTRKATAERAQVAGKLSDLRENLVRTLTHRPLLGSDGQVTGLIESNAIQSEPVEPALQEITK